MRLLALSLASLAALLLPTAAVPIDDSVPTTHMLEARQDKVCQGQSKIAFPQPGQVLPANKPFKIVYCSAAYFKINTLSVEAYFSSSDDATRGIFATLLGPLQSSSSDKYGQFSFSSEQLKLPEGSNANGFIFVQEKTTQYPSSGTSVNIFKVPVKVA